MLPRKRLQGLTIAAAGVALLALPGVAHATPQFRLNGALAGTTTQDVVQFGTLTLQPSCEAGISCTLPPPLTGEWKCNVLAGVSIWNEGGAGLASVESWRPYNCSTASCPGPASVTTETPVELTEKENFGQTELRAERGHSTLPWPAETVAPEAGVSRLEIRKIALFLACPAEAFEVRFEGLLEPLILNGVKNGLSPSHLVFEGKGRKTGSLETPAMCIRLPCDLPELYFSGALTTIGTKEELITAK